MTTIVALAISSIMLHDYCVLFVMRTVKIYSLSNFEVYNAVLLTTITMLYINLQNLSTSCKLLPLNIFPIRFFIFYFFLQSSTINIHDSLCLHYVVIPRMCSHVRMKHKLASVGFLCFILGRFMSW